MPLRIETTRLVLTPEVEQDAEWFAELLTARGTGTFTTQQARERIAAMTATIHATGIGVLVLRRKPDGDALGYCGLVRGRASIEEPELAYELLPRAQGSGYATEAGRAVVDAAFATGRRRLWSTVRPWNAPSLRVLVRLGFHRHHTTVDDRGEVIWLLREQ